MKLGEMPAFIDAGTKDAVHVAVVVSTNLSYGFGPGDMVAFRDASLTRIDLVDHRSKAHGVVDPLMFGRTKAGIPVLVMMYPGTTEGLRHEWDITVPGLVEPEEEDLDLSSGGDECSGCQ